MESNHDNRLDYSPSTEFSLSDGVLVALDPQKRAGEPPRPILQRAKTLPGKLSRARLVKIKAENAAALSAYPGADLPAMPKNFGECLERFGATDPCPYARCKHHLAVDVLPGSGARDPAVKVNFPLAETAIDIPDTCSLRVAALNPEGQTLADVAQRLNITRERARQIEVIALSKLRGAMSPYHPSENYNDHWDDTDFPEPEVNYSERDE